MATRVFTVEIIEELAAEARRRLTRLGYGNIEYKVGDGSMGWPQHGPFDRHVTELPYSRIQRVSYRVKGLIATVFRHGSLIIESAGNEEDRKSVV